MKNKKQYAVIGLGSFGFSLAKTLFENGADVLAIDKDYELVNAIEPFCTQAMCFDATNEKSVEKLGLNNMDECVVCLSSDVQASIFICLNLLRCGIKNIRAKALNGKHKTVLEKIGVLNVIIPEREMGRKVALEMVRPNMLEVLSLSKDFSLVEIKPPQKWLGKTIIELDLRRSEKISVVAIKRGDLIIADNLRNIVFEVNDLLLVYGNAHDINKLSNKATKSVN